MGEKDKKDYKGITLIKSPTEVSQLMKDLWINHKNGIPIPKNNVFIVNLPHMEQKENKSTNKGDNLIDKKGCNDTNIYNYVKIIPELCGKLSKFTKGIQDWSKRRLINLDNPDDLSKVRLILRVIAQTPAFDFFDEDFNGYSPENICKIIGMSPNIPKKDTKISFDYEIIPVKSFKEAKEIAHNESWCIVISEESFNDYTKGGNRFYFLANKNWEKVPCLPGMNFPYDEYGYSLMAIEMSPENEIVSVTSRWNECADNSGKFLTESQLKEILGDNYNDLLIE